MPRPFVHDQWSPVGYASSVGDGTQRPPGARTWVDNVDARRLAVYAKLAAYLDNVARYYLPDHMWDRPVVRDDQKRIIDWAPAPAEKQREYGDPALLVQQARSFVLGDDQTMVVPDAAPPPEDATPEEVEAQKRAEKFAQWIDNWVEQEALWLRLLEGEENAIGLSDGVYEITWDAEDGVPRTEVHDPGFYFPVLTGPSAAKSGRYPNRVHLAWEEQDQETGVTWLHRKTYSREKLPIDEAGLQTSRHYEYQEPGESSEWTVYYSYAKWDLSKTSGEDLYKLGTRNAVFFTDTDGVTPLDRKDMFLDFVPVVHVPNDAAGRRHFGRSLLLRIAQLLDELAATDTDLAANSSDLGSPPVITSSPVGPAGLTAGPGAVWSGIDAKLLDTSKALDAQIKYLEQLLDRLSRNTRLAKALLGDIAPNEVPSGIAYELGFAATKNLIREMRLVRSEKYPLIPRFAMRMAQQFRPTESDPPVLPPGPTPRAEIRLGPFMPADKQAAVDRVVALLKARAISTLTGVQMLIEAGFSIDDAEDEVARIQAESMDAAVQLVEATGDVAAARRFLGLDPAAAPGDASTG